MYCSLIQAQTQKVPDLPPHFVAPKSDPKTQTLGSDSESLLNDLIARAPKDLGSSTMAKQLLTLLNQPMMKKLSPKQEFEIQKGVIVHPEWMVGDEMYRAAKANQKEMMAALLPKLTGGIDYGDRQVGSNPMTRSQKYDYRSSTTQMSLKQLVYDFGASWNMWKSSDMRAEAVAARVKIARSDLVLQAVSASLEEQRSLLQVMWSTTLVEERQKFVNKVTERFDLGGGTIYEVAKAKAKLSEAMSAQRFNQQKHRSALMLKSQYGLGQDFVLPPLKISQVKHQTDIDGHPLMEEADFYIKSAELESSATSALALPRLALEANATRRDFNGYNQNMNDSSVLLTLTYNFMSGGADSAKTDQAGARLAQAKSEKMAKMMRLSVDVDRAFTEHKAYYDSLNDAKENLHAFMSMYLAQRELFEMQRGNLMELANTEDDLSQAMKLFINNWIDYSISSYRLHHAQGDLLSLVGLYSKVALD